MSRDDPRSSARAVRRLVAVLATLLVLALLAAAAAPGQSGLQTALQALGPFGPPAFVLLATGLALMFVPGGLLAAAAGAVFGTGLGFLCSVLSATLTAVLGAWIGARSSHQAVQEISGPRAQALMALAQRHGILVVVAQRLMPAIPDAPLSYAFGAMGLRRRQLALGTLIGAAPRAFSYAALGEAAVTGNARLAAIAVLVLVLVAAAGVALGAWLTRRRRVERAASLDEETAD